MKQTWNNINAVINKTSDKQDLPEKFIENDEEITSKSDIARKFNELYTDIGPSLANKIPQFTGNPIDYLQNYNFPNSFYFEPCSPTEIINTIKFLKPKSSSGHDGISPKLLKQCTPSIAEPLSHIANLSMTHGTFPSLMKIAKVIPIYKKDNRSHFLNYRPISLLPTFSKIIEKLVHKRLLHYLTTHNILSYSQYGFQPNMSTELAILESQDRIVKAIASKKFCLGLFIDLSKAFDTLNHSILITKLQHIGIRGTPLNWFHSYLTKRHQYVSFKNVESSQLQITCGVPQGSILGPLLFLIYINDLKHALTNAKPILFADDTTLLLTNDKYHTLIEDTNIEINKLHKWFSLNRLSLNISKTNYIIFRTTNKIIPENEIPVKIGNIVIERVNTTKFLGVHLDDTLNWKTHINTKSNQVLKVVAILAKLKHTLPQFILMTIYNSLILPQLNYAITAWGNMQNKEIKRLTTLQKKAIRHISNSKYNSHTSPLFKKMKLLTLQDLFHQNCCKLYHKIAQSKLRPYFHEQLQRSPYLHDKTN
jgi:hypothetical protein